MTEKQSDRLRLGWRVWTEPAVGSMFSISRHSFGHSVETMCTSHMYFLSLGSSMSIHTALPPGPGPRLK